MPLRDNAYENLRSDILTCRLAPGDDRLRSRCALTALKRNALIVEGSEA
ncbi:hypothetical protein [Bradyrhizobium sp.]